jgi:hypothetical protein
MSRRANPDRTLAAILDADSHATALRVLVTALDRTWESGHSAGFKDGVEDATADNPKPRKPNPYRRDHG